MSLRSLPPFLIAFNVVGYLLQYVAPIIGLLGNVLVIIVYARTYKRGNNNTDYLVINLAVVDIAIVVSQSLEGLWFYFRLHFRYALNNILCRFEWFVYFLVFALSAATLLSISIERFRAIMMPLRGAWNKRQVKVLISCIWLICTIVVTPVLFISRLDTQYHNYPIILGIKGNGSNSNSGSNFSNVSTTVMTMSNRTIYFCIISGPNSNAYTDAFPIMYAIIIYILPLIIMITAYSCMTWKLWKHVELGQNTMSIRRKQKRNRKIVMMFSIITIAFMLCYAPFVAWYIIEQFYTPYHIGYRLSLNRAFFSRFKYLPALNSAINPVVYAFAGNSFKQRLRELFRTVRRRKSYNLNLTDMINISPRLSSLKGQSQNISK
ncbi:Tachykinin-like peptides receptor 99D [Trichoplax sp. H2]|uniref:G-protein coupled receptors family 1 profile domain-containing protein n=1 Tax=Trichoplax adhaerens TaxID=10228 RepID=B3RZ59_TRIAD|nr:hypothetical protein TRIADDRAFT_57337 [Trichoplax adhaerens]EDV24145.1 hypothetical protein TRIADDRAFT_57337 [Trichoplax adhaerens]RDD43269.1 Tachykinin-like peptides receptor 99D [Trichoplax sp. H2]|eukprot:XP_002113671.1 hypothetical protein TRIADDRAFT_57337 [Trichoplax adhaerens]